MTFSNRKHAGRLLAEKLITYKTADVVVLALPRGGVPVAAEIANAMGARLDVLIVRKIGAPFQPEFAVGAICEDAEPYLSDQTLSQCGLEPDNLGPAIKAESLKINKQIVAFRDGRALPTVAQKVVIVVDDGLATGSTMSAAIKYLKKKNAAKIIVAVPVGAASTVKRLRSKVDEVVVVEEREDLRSVGEWYDDFTQVSDEQVVSLLKQYRKSEPAEREPRGLAVPVDEVELLGDLTTFPEMKSLVVFVHGSGSSRKSPRNKMVADYLNTQGLGTFLFDLLTDAEAQNRKNVFDIDFLSQRLVAVTRWLRKQPGLQATPLAYFGASTGGGAAIQAAASLTESEAIYAIVSRGGRPDLASAQALAKVKAPTLLLVGSLDVDVLELNRQAQKRMSSAELSIIDGATHLFEESGALEEVAKQTAAWLSGHLKPDYPDEWNLESAIAREMVPIRSDSDLDQLV